MNNLEKRVQDLEKRLAECEIIGAMKAKKKNAAAAALGRKGGKARAKKLSPAELSEQGRRAVRERWKKAKNNA